MAAELAELSGSVIVNYTGFERLGVLRIQYPQIAEQYRGAGKRILIHNTQYPVYTIKQTSSNRRANNQQMHSKYTCMMCALIARCLLDDCLIV